MSLVIPRFALMLTFLGYASICDVRTRRFFDKVWLVGVPAGLALYSHRCFDWGDQPNIIADFLVRHIRLGLHPVLCKAFLWSRRKSPSFHCCTPLGRLEAFRPFLGRVLPIPVLTVFCNSILLCLVYPAAISALNFDVLRGSNLLMEVKVDGVLGKLVLMATTRRVSFEKLWENVGYYSAERLIEEGGLVRETVYFVRVKLTGMR